MDVIGDSEGEVSDRIQVIGNQRQGDPYYKVATNMTELCSSVLWIELVNNETGYSAEEFSK